MTRRYPPVRGLWAEFEREAHRAVLNLVDAGAHDIDPESVASRVLFAHADITSSMRDEYLDALTEVVRKHVELLNDARTRS
jgi:hypothetical protein